jgi:hypothetical protein
MHHVFGLLIDLRPGPPTHALPPMTWQSLPIPEPARLIDRPQFLFVLVSVDAALQLSRAMSVLLLLPQLAIDSSFLPPLEACSPQAAKNLHLSPHPLPYHF